MKIFKDNFELLVKEVTVACADVYVVIHNLLCTMSFCHLLESMFAMYVDRRSRRDPSRTNNSSGRR